MEKGKDNPTERNRKMMGGDAKKIIAKHKVEEGQTLSHIALKYYHHATPPYWKFILEYNQALLKGDEKNMRTGLVLEIPELPENLKD
jgi:nucleoid-associated protein YgaU